MHYDLNGNLVAEQDAPIEALADTSVLTPIFSERVGKDVYKEDYGWAVSNPDRGKKKNTAVSTLNSGIYQRKFSWDERNMLIQSSDALHTVRYRYGADGQRTNKFSMTTDSGETIYFNKLWTWRHDSYTPNAGNYCKNIFLDKTRIVTKVRAADETSSADAHREYFYHGDHLQSATLITDYEGSVYERINYTPYGELWLEKSDNNGENYLPYRFTGKELDSETGLYYYGARYLDPMYSRWLSTDPALGEYIPQAPISDEARRNNANLPGMGGLFNPINGSLYHYAGNNPVRYIDPTGKSAKNNAKKYLVGRTEGEIEYTLNGKKEKTHYVILKDGDFCPSAFDGLFDENGNAVKVSGQEEKGENIDVTVVSSNDSLFFGFDNVKSSKINKKNDRIKETLNIFLPKSKEFDLSGEYKDIDKEKNPLHSWWTGGTASDEAGPPDKWAENYNSSKQKAIREELGVKREAVK